ncbi:ABC transporter ATP-binding protein [Ligilactobacillus murinus]|uniref:ABC transporter ATP-binding protein n=2 Tax=Ligilactobacillus murinus TaxID=1622 RepID=A0A4S2EDK8_9LACO|nr:ABC transporter ATP-binding protein [Ligilactobacillus murinus]TGY52313.1 ABC transporter ATP-binding protein [Ligilactobacillus murinus]
MMISYILTRKNIPLLLALFIFLAIGSFDGVVLSAIISYAGTLHKDIAPIKILLFGIFSLLGWSIIHLSQYYMTITASKLIRTINLNLKQDFIWAEYLNSNRVNDASKVISKITSDFKLIESQYFHPLLSIIANFLICLVSLVYMLYSNAVVSLFFIFFSLLPILAPLLYAKKLKLIADTWSTENEKYIKGTTDFFQGMSVLKIYGIYKELYTRLYSLLDALENKNYSLKKIQAQSEFFSSLLAGISFIVPFVIGCFYVLYTNSLTISSLLAIFLLNDRIVGPLSTIAENINSIKTTAILREKIMLTIKNSDIKTVTISHKPSRIDMLEINDVTYKMNNGSTLTLNEIFKDEFKILILGDSGSGKTTILKLISHTISPNSGNIKAYTSSTTVNLKQQIAYISQKPYIFNATLRDNITLFQNNYSDHEITDVLKQLSLYYELGADNCLNYRCGTNGEYLSGGQIQRIEIARGLLRNKSLFLLDEITASLDKNNAEKIRNILFDLPISFIEVAHHYNEKESRYTGKFILSEGHLYKI